MQSGDFSNQNQLFLGKANTDISIHGMILVKLLVGSNILTLPEAVPSAFTQGRRGFRPKPCRAIMTRRRVGRGYGRVQKH
jgi:hypothetical protein